MKKAILYILMILSFTGIVFAGSLDNYIFNAVGAETSDDNVTIDADTLDGSSASDFATLAYISARDARWSRDNTGMGKTTLARYLSGDKDMFSKFDTFVDYLKTIFATNEKIDALESRLDAIQAESKGLTLDQYQKSEAVKTGSYGPYACYEDVCFKQVA